MHTYRRCRTHTARGVCTPPTLRVHSCTLPTVSLHLRTLTHGNLRLGTVCVYAHCTSRRNAYTTRRSAYTQRRCVYTKVRQPTHVPVFIGHFRSCTHMIYSIGFVHAGPCACFTLACPIFYFNLNLYILDIFILLLLFSRCVTNVHCRISFSYKNISSIYIYCNAFYTI